MAGAATRHRSRGVGGADRAVVPADQPPDVLGTGDLDVLQAQIVRASEGAYDPEDADVVRSAAVYGQIADGVALAVERPGEGSRGIPDGNEPARPAGVDVGGQAVGPGQGGRIRVDSLQLGHAGDGRAAVGARADRDGVAAGDAGVARIGGDDGLVARRLQGRAEGVDAVVA